MKKIIITKSSEINAEFNTEKVRGLLSDMYSLAFSSLRKIGNIYGPGIDEDIIVGQFFVLDMDKFAHDYISVLVELGLATESDCRSAKYLGIKEE